MKTKVVTSVFLFLGIFIYGQSGSGFGLKGGLNYNGNGKFYNSAEAIYENPTKNIGYHFGVFGKVGTKLYVRPEMMYSSTTSSYDEGDLVMNKIDAPVLVGLKIVGPLCIFLGPDFQYIVNTKFDGVSINDIEKEFTVGLHIGAGVNLGKLGIDVRYERGFSENEIAFINNNIINLSGDRVDTRPDQVILSLSLKL